MIKRFLVFYLNKLSMDKFYSHFKVHKNENFLGFDFEFCTVSLLVLLKYKGFVKRNF